MPKDDPLQQTKTLWLDRDAMEIARERYWHAWNASLDAEFGEASDRAERASKAIWDISWAAAVAVHSFITEGRLGPPVDDSEPAS